MKATFTSELKRGLLSKSLFLDSQVTKDFIEWLLPFINGTKSLRTLHYSFDSFKEAVGQYKWPETNSEDFETTYNRFERYRDDFKSGNDEIITNNCLDVLNWGGVAAANKGKIDIRTSMKCFIDDVLKLIKQEEIIIYDLNPNYINSGFTKIYAASDERFIMYDGRVESALGYLILKYLQQNDKNNLPEELIFGYGIGRGIQERNPSKKTDIIRFPEITQNRSQHFVSNIKANWLAESIIKRSNLFGFDSDAKNIFAFQTALFVLGKETPKTD